MQNMQKQITNLMCHACTETGNAASALFLLFLRTVLITVFSVLPDIRL